MAMSRSFSASAAAPTNNAEILKRKLSTVPAQGASVNNQGTKTLFQRPPTTTGTTTPTVGSDGAGTMGKLLEARSFGTTNLGTPAAASSASLSTPTSLSQRLGQTASGANGVTRVNGVARPNGASNFEGTNQGSYAGSGRAPSLMSLGAATTAVEDSVNPTYAALRSRQELTSSQEREQIPQLLAARYGLSGTRGGRAQSSYADNTQSENADISSIEGQRQQALTEAALAYQEKDFARAMDKWKTSESLRMQQESLDMQQQQIDNQATQWQQGFDYQKLSDSQKLQLSYDQMNMSNEQFEKTYGLSKAQTEQSIKESEFGMDENSWANRLKINESAAGIANTEASTANILNAIANRSSGGGGSSGGSSGGSGSEGMSYSTALTRATDAAKADPRLENGEFTLAQLIDAYMTMFAYQQ